MSTSVQHISIKKRVFYFFLVLATIPVVLVGIFLTQKLYDHLRWTKWVELSQKVTLGMSKEEVLSIMGQPTTQADENRYNKEEWDAFFYRVPQLMPFSFDREIYVGFDPHKVNLVEVRPFSQIKFNSDDWKKSTPYRRWSMVDDLISSKVLLNKNKEEVIAILGEPDVAGEGYIYDAGPERGFGVDSQLLVVKFIENKVSWVMIRTD